MRILVSGLVGQYAFGGVTWDYLQYVLGFRALGHEVWYLEDSANWAYDPLKGEPSADCSHNVSYLDRIMREFDMGDRWIYRNEPDGKYHGITDERIAEKTISEADVLANVSGACWLRPVTAGIKTKLFLDGDPIQSQRATSISPMPRIFMGPTALSRRGALVENYAHADRARTVGQNRAVRAAAGSGLDEFEKIIDLPRRVEMPLHVAVGGANAPLERLAQHVWSVVGGPEATLTPERYRNFIASSRGELSTAKHVYVATRSGWFSCRSACYLVAGRQVVVHDTGFSSVIPAVDGLLPFQCP